MKRWAVGASRAAVATCWLAGSAVAQAPDSRVVVECPAFDAESRAALEARAKADLIVRHVSGTLSFVCGAAGRVTWTPAGGDTVQGDVPLAPNTNEAIERFLESAEGLLLAASAPVPPAPPPADSTQVPPAAPPAEAPPPPEPEAATPVVSESPSPRAPAARGIPFGAAAGGVFEMWDSPPALGASGLVRWYVSRHLRLDAVGMLLFTTEASLGISGRVVRGAAGAEWSFGADERFRVGARAFVDSLRASAADGGGSSEDVSAGGRVHATYAVPLAGSVSLVFGPFLAVRGAPVRVELGAREAFRVPVVTGGAEIQLEWDGR